MIDQVQLLPQTCILHPSPSKTTTLRGWWVPPSPSSCNNIQQAWYPSWLHVMFSCPKDTGYICWFLPFVSRVLLILKKSWTLASCLYPSEAPLTNTCCLCLNRGNPTCLKKMVGFSNAPTKNGGFMCVMTCNFWLDNSVAPWLQAPQKTNGLRGTWSLLAYLTSQNASFQPSLEEVL